MTTDQDKRHMARLKWDCSRIAMGWFLALFMIEAAHNGDLDNAWNAIMTATSILAPTFMVMIFAVLARVHSAMVWFGISLFFALGLNSYTWVTAIAPGGFPTWVWFGVVATNLACLAGIHGLFIYTRDASTQGPSAPAVRPQ